VVRVGPLATGIEAPFAEEAFAAGDRKGNDDAVTDLERLVLGADLHDLAHRFVAHHIARFHGRDHSVIDVQIRAADRAGSDFDNRVAGMLDFGIGHRVAAHVVLAVPAERLHL
jgi:hypothetical protein